jgi:alanyl-tRNA synthetase
MTTQRLYYSDSYTTVFDARCIERTAVNSAPAVVLDRSYFYPTSGGQPHDTGTLNGIPVIDVVVREGDGAVLHVLERPLDADEVHGEIDWARRFDYMQHHTGQHILSQAFVRLAEAETVGFHMSADSITIDLDTPALDAALIERVETLANQIVFENRPVRAWFPDEAELAELVLRKTPEVEGRLRVVEVADFDLNACGGTHVARTGSVGMIKILKTERRGDTLRVEFRCGGRALAEFRSRHAVLSDLSAALTTGYTDVPAVVEKLREENQSLRKELRAARSALLDLEAERLRAATPHNGEYALVRYIADDGDPQRARELVQKLIAYSQTIVLCGVPGDKAQLIVARSEDLPQDMVPVLRAGLSALGVERGGGRPSFAQGGGAPATLETLGAALDAAAAALRSEAL